MGLRVLYEYMTASYSSFKYSIKGAISLQLGQSGLKKYIMETFSFSAGSSWENDNDNNNESSIFIGLLLDNRLLM